MPAIHIHIHTYTAIIINEQCSVHSTFNFLLPSILPSFLFLFVLSFFLSPFFFFLFLSFTWLDGDSNLFSFSPRTFGLFLLTGNQLNLKC